MHITMFAGGTDDLLKIDLSLFNVKFYKVGSNQFRTWLKGAISDITRFNDAWKYYADYETRMDGMIECLYVLAPIEVSKPIQKRISSVAEMALLIMFPSDFNIIAEIDYTTGHDDHFFRTSTVTWRYKVSALSPVGFPKYLTIGKTKPKDVSQFIINFGKPDVTKEYLLLAVQSYYNSFFQNEMRLCYTTLFIALESLTMAETEITYQISRHCAVINSKNIEQGKAIFNKTKKLYSLRSKIVHGDEKVKGELIKLYYPHLQLLAAQTIIELFSHKIADKHVLAEMVNQTGFGKKATLSEEYINYKIFPSNYDILFLPLPQLSKHPAKKK